jgi:tetratricopeptide (TPR) repeat protein
MSLAALAEALGESEDGLSDALDTVGDDTVLPLVDGRLTYAPALLDGRMFSRRLGADEVAHDVLTLNPDLEAILEGPEASRQLVSGAPLPLLLPRLEDDPDWRPVPEEVRHPNGSLLLPVGALAEAGAGVGDLVGLRFTAAGLELCRLAAADLVDPRPVQEALGRVLSPDRPTEIGPALLSVCVDVPEAFRLPVAPLTELIAAAGLNHVGDFLAPPGFDIARYQVKLRRDYLARRYDLSADEALATLALLRRFECLLDASLPGSGSRWHTSEAGESAVAAGPLLAEPAVADALLRETLRRWPEAANALHELVDELEPHASRSVRPALHWLRAKAYEARGEVAEAEQALFAAERVDPNWPLALLDLARYAGDRGDAVRGLGLLRRAAPYTDTDLEELLKRFSPVPGPVVGRNDPCWCGSGRKFKQCHLHRPAQCPLAERASWLYAKAGRYLAEGRWWHLLDSVAEERTAYADDDEAIDEMGRDPLVGDAVLFEGGAFAEFLAVRGDLLPADERLLGEQWLLVDRSVYEVAAVRRGAGLTLRDLRTGDVHDVQERLGGGQLRTGQLICARVVPAGDTMQIFGGIDPVRLDQRDTLLDLLDREPEPEEVVAFLTRRFAPPTLVTSDQDRIVIHDAVLAPSDSVALIAALDRTYRRIEDSEPPEWIEEHPADGRDRIYSFLRLSSQGLHVHTNSDRRIAAVVETIRGLDPGVRVLSDQRQPMPDTRAAAQLARERPVGPSTVLDPNDPPVRDAMTAYIADYERQWLDLSIPALKGLTPRQAAADPTRREDLVQLLATFPETGDPTAMSAGRLRAALGLDG